MDIREVDWSGSGSCPLAGFDVTGADPSDSASCSASS
jgi:hypothetical protein